MTRAAGFTPLWGVEVSQSYITRRITGVKFESDTCGKVSRDAKNEPRSPADALLERRNHLAAVEEAVELLDGEKGAYAWGQRILSLSGVDPDELPDRCKIPEEGILDYKVPYQNITGQALKRLCPLSIMTRPSASSSCWFELQPELQKGNTVQLLVRAPARVRERQYSSAVGSSSSQS
jgi:hypothetical protein